MTETTNLGLPFIAASQAQKHVTHNEALLMLDAAVQLAVLDANRTAPPPSPAAGQRHLVAVSPTGAWSGKAKQVAIWQDGAWAFLIPKSGWRAWSVFDEALLLYDGSAWRDLRALPLANLARLGVNTTATPPNLLAVRSNAALFTALNAADAGSGDVRVQLSKESEANTASFIFSDAFSARAEFGLNGDDDFRIKVSPDGTSWFDALRIARGSGKVSFPASGGPRETLNAPRTYYVRTDGSDSNSGLANTAAGAFLTVQKAVDVVCSLDLSVQQVTIKIADGTYGGSVQLRPYVGALPPIILGNVAAPANVVISTVSHAFANPGGGAWQINSLKVTTSTGHGLNVTAGGITRFQGIVFGNVGGYQIVVGPSSSAAATGAYEIAGGAQYHIASNGHVALSGNTVTITGAPAFSGATVLAGRGGVVDCASMTFVNAGAVTGQRYFAVHNGVIFSNGGGANLLPGSVAGTTATGGIYA